MTIRLLKIRSTLIRDKSYLVICQGWTMKNLIVMFIFLRFKVDLFWAKCVIFKFGQPYWWEREEEVRFSHSPNCYKASGNFPDSFCFLSISLFKFLSLSLISPSSHSPTTLYFRLAFLSHALSFLLATCLSSSFSLPVCIWIEFLLVFIFVCAFKLSLFSVRKPYFNFQYIFTSVFKPTFYLFSFSPEFYSPPSLRHCSSLSTKPSSLYISLLSRPHHRNIPRSVRLNKNPPVTEDPLIYLDIFRVERKLKTV